MRKILLAVLVGTIFSHAQNLCVQLCLECSTDNSNAMCSQINETCGNCVAILDSIHQHEDSLAQARFQDSLATIAREDSLTKEKQRQDSLQKIDARKFGEIIHNNCKNDTCIYDVTVENRLLKHIKAKKENKNAGTWTVNKDTVTNRLPPMSAECSGFCSNCEENATNALCGKIEEQCRCAEYREEALRLQEKATVDSLAAIQSFLKKMQQAQKTSSRIFEYCEKDTAASLCSLTVKISGETLSLLNRFDNENPVPNDSVKKDSVDSLNARALADSLEQHQSGSTSSKKKNRYVGISLAYEAFDEETVANRYATDSDNLGFNLGFFVRNYRNYLSNAVAFQTGINLIYHHGDYDISNDVYGHPSASIYYHSFMLEIPIQGRFIVPIPKFPVLPFASVSVHIRKPVYAFVFYDVYGRYYHDGDTMYDDFYCLSDFEFLLYLGGGIELIRHFSLQWQFLPLSIVTHSDNLMNYENTFRINLDFAW